VATVIDSLVVLLGLDAKQFRQEREKLTQESAALKSTLEADAQAGEAASTKAVKATAAEVKERIEALRQRRLEYAERQQLAKETAEAEKKARGQATKETIDDHKKVKGSYEDVARQALKTAAVLVSANGIKNYIAQTIEGYNQLKTAADNAGMSASALAAFGMVIERNGGNRAAAQSSMMGLAAAMQTWRTTGQASGDLRLGFANIGANLQDDPTAVFEKFSKWAEGKDKVRVAQVGRMLGFDEDSINMAMKGQKKFMEELKKSYELGVPSDKDVEKIRKFKSALAEMTQAIKGNANEMIVSGAEALTPYIEKLGVLIQKNPEATQGILGLGAAFAALGAIWTAIKVPVWLLRLLGIAAPAAGAGAAAAGGTAAAVTAPAWALPAAVTAVLGYAISPGNMGQENNEDEFMAGEFARHYGRGVPKYTQPRPAGAPGFWPTMPEGTTAERQAKAKAYFMSQGWSEHQASGMVAAMTAENDTLDPQRRNPRSAGKSHATGVGQWLAARQAVFKKWSGGVDVKDASFEMQLAFIQHELTQGEEAPAGRRIRNAKTARAASDAYLIHYMRPGGGLGGDQRRAERALPGIMSIGTVNIQTQATDAKGIATDFQKEMYNRVYVAQANSGVAP